MSKKFKNIFRIKGRIIHMQKPILLPDNAIKRSSVVNNKIFEKLISSEAFLRGVAYKNTSIKTDKSFFDDSDMKSDYYLILIYDRKSHTPLLSARYYFDKAVINKYLKGDHSENTFNINKFKEGKIFLIDRMSGNNYSSIYRQNWNYIHLLFYSKLLKQNYDCKFIAMARKEKYEKLLAKYLRLGLRIVGATKHNGQEHWILLGDFKKNYSQLKMSTLFNIMLMSKILFSK